MTTLIAKPLALAAACTLLLVGISCSSKEKAEPKSNTGEATRTISMTEGEAGGIVEDVVTVSATVHHIDRSTRQVTLMADDGTKATFTAGPEVKNFDQLKVKDKVTATILERLTVFVNSDGAAPSVTHAAAVAAAPKGAKPGALVAESYELIATVKSIDSAKRTATLLFADGQTRTVTVRPDVDLSKYQAGDSVVIRVTTALRVLVAKP